MSGFNSDDELRITVGELCGCKWGHPVFNHDGKWHVHFGKEPFEFDSSWAGKPAPFDQCVKEIDCPDYPRDLNAMHEAEKALKLGMRKHAKYQELLEQITIERNRATGCNPIFATARQRAEAFVLALSGRGSGVGTEINTRV